MDSLLIIGICLILGLFSSFLIKKLTLPQIVAQIGVGIVLGISGLRVFGPDNLDGFAVFTQLALGLIGFSIGGELRWGKLKRVGKSILIITFFESMLSMLFVFTALFILTSNLPLSLIIGALAAATDPGGTSAVIQEFRGRGPLTSTLFGVIGADDAMAILIYTICFNTAKVLLTGGHDYHVSTILAHVSMEILGAIALGCVVGFIFVNIMRWFKDEDVQLLLSLGSILICCGLAREFGMSLILCSMTLGIFLSNWHPQKTRPFFSTIGRLTAPIFMLFFILVGAGFNINALPTMGLIGLVYIVFRTIGKISGAGLGGVLSKAPKTVTKYLGICLLSQAGVAVGLAISAKTELTELSKNLSGESIIAVSELGGLIITVITATTLVFQIFGPILAKVGLDKSGELRALSRR